jgi:aquaporin TIP
MSYRVAAEELTEVDTWKAVLAETIGSLVLVLIGTGTIVASGAVEAGALNSARLVAIALAFGLTYAVVVAATVGVSGGHINPIVTFGAMLAQRIGIAKGGAYIIGQLVGAIVASFLLEALLAGAVEGSLGAVAVSGAMENVGAGLAVELILGFVLVFVMMAVVIGPGPSAPPTGPASVGFMVVVGTLLAFALTGAAMNPARALGPALAANLWDDHWIYWVGPLGGAAVAVFVFEGIFLGRLLPAGAGAPAVDDSPTGGPLPSGD